VEKGACGGGVGGGSGRGISLDEDERLTFPAQSCLIGHLDGEAGWKLRRR